MAPTLEFKNQLISAPFFSVCIPQYNRTNFLLKALEILTGQTFKNYEVCISDGGSTDGGTQGILDFLKSNRFSFVLRTHASQCRYDKNLRESISLAAGRYCLLMGNDDALAGPGALETLYRAIAGHDNIGVVITNYEDWSSGIKTWRIPKGGFVGSGPQVAAKHFRNLSFVSGVLLDARCAQSFATEKWDGSEMYQMYIAARIIASGKSLLELDGAFIRKDIQIAGEAVDSYRCKPRVNLHWSTCLESPILQVGALVSEAIKPYLPSALKESALESIWKQLYSFTYPFWIFEYRKAQSWKYAFCLARSMSPGRLLKGIDLTRFSKLRLWSVYLAFTASALLIPTQIFNKLRSALYAFAKKRR